MSGQSSEALGAAVRFIARRNDQIQRALQVLQRAQRYDLQPLGDYQGEGMVQRDNGDYVDADDVDRAIQILQEGQQ